tara:strand:- start:4079 stop:5230 length:1152 start_codon:yes stop_codon:yes gene_type:complete
LSFEPVPTYSVKELNNAIGSLILRGFAPRFLLNATISKCQLKRGHLWMTLTDGTASIDAVVWASQLPKITFKPKEEDGVVIVGKLNFWAVQARISINVIDIRVSISTVLRRFEVVRDLLISEGLINFKRHRKLPVMPNCIAVLTSVPSSALADISRTAKERWPLTKVIIVPIPVQGDTAKKIELILSKLSTSCHKFGIKAVILARGGGSREDLMIFDNENICRELALFPVPVVTGIGHEDDLTVADLVADHRAATPTAAIVDLLPSREIVLSDCIQKKRRFIDYFTWFLKDQRINLLNKKKILEDFSPLTFIDKNRIELNKKKQILDALSPINLLKRGFSIIRSKENELIQSIDQIANRKTLNIEFYDGNIELEVKNSKTIIK